MGDEISLGELSRQLADWREMTRQNFAAIDTRLQVLATQTVPGAVYQADRSAVDEKFLAAQKLSDERYQKLRDDIASLTAAHAASATEAKERSKRIASNRFVLMSSAAGALIFPLMLYVFEKVIG